MKLRSKMLVMGSVLAAALTVAAVGAMLTMAAGDPAAGKTLFLSSGCGGCHGLADAGALGGSASNFDQTKPALVAIVAAIQSPPGGMPPNILSQQQAEDIAAYIVSVAGVQAPGSGGPGSGSGESGGSGPDSGTGSVGKSTVRVTLYKSGKIRIRPKKATAGKVTFKIKNRTKRKLNISVIRISKKSKSHRKLRVKRGRVSEKRRVGKKIKLSRSKRTKKVSRKLKTGKYLLIYNRRGNYKKKRYAVLKVTKPKSKDQGSSQSPGQSTSTGTGTSTGEQPGDDDGPPLPPFLAAGCGGCHKLADAGAMGASASSLDIEMPSKATVVEVVTNGITHEYRNPAVPAWDAMPAYAASMTAQEIDELATYVSEVTGGGVTAGEEEGIGGGCPVCHDF